MDDVVKKYKRRRDERLKARQTECDVREDYGVPGMKWGEHKSGSDNQTSKKGSFRPWEKNQKPEVEYTYKKPEKKPELEWSPKNRKLSAKEKKWLKERNEEFKKTMAGKNIEDDFEEVEGSDGKKWLVPKKTFPI